MLSPGAPYPGNPAGIVTAITFPKLTYKAVLAHDFSDNVHAYISYNRGFKSGTYNPTNFSNQPSRPEILDAFEAGVKSDLFDRLLRLNLSGFHYNYKDIQVRTGAPPAPPGSTITYNAAAARVNGAELQMSLVPSRAFSINASATYLDGIYSQFANATCTVPRAVTATVLGGNNTVPCDNSGHRLANTSRFSYNLNATYTLETKVGSFALSANDSYKSRSYWDASNRLSQDPYHLVSASLTWTSPDKRFDVQAYVRNLTKAYYFANGIESAKCSKLEADDVIRKCRDSKEDRHRIDVLIVDLVLPGSTGHEVIAAVKRHSTGIKVIATTAFLKQTQLEIVKYLGAGSLGKMHLIPHFHVMNG